ncbi:MAG: DNA ligase N terminus-domain-containing protein, partial [Olpidium bornovanus]
MAINAAERLTRPPSSLLGQLDKERGSYGMKENLLAKVYVDLLGMSKEATTAQELLRWKIPAKGGKVNTFSACLSPQGPVADFAEILYDKLKTRSSVRTWSTLTMNDVNRQLDVLSRDKAAGKQVFQFFFERSTPLEQKWLIRIVIKDLRIGMTERVILPIFHPDAYTLFTHASNLRKVCEELQDPNKRVSSKVRLELFHPFRPMLCKRLENVKTVLRDMNHHPFWIERKLDGERAQLHKKGNEYRYWSRYDTSSSEKL